MTNLPTRPPFTDTRSETRTAVRSVARKTLPLRRPLFSPGPQPIVYRYTQQFRQHLQSALLPATWGPRVAARLLELLVIGIPFNLLYDFIFTFVPEDWLELSLPFIGRDFIFWLVFALITTLTAGRSRASFGKRILNLRVAGAFNRKIPFGLFFLRELLFIYSLISFYQTLNLIFLLQADHFLSLNAVYLPGFGLGLGFVFLFFNPPRPTFLDRLFKSQVVIADNNKLLD